MSDIIVITYVTKYVSGIIFTEPCVFMYARVAIYAKPKCMSSIVIVSAEPLRISANVIIFCLVFAMPLCTSVYMCFVVTCWERADLLALVCGVLL